MSKEYIEKEAVLAICDERIKIADGKAEKGEATFGDAIIAGSAQALRNLVEAIPPADVKPVVGGEMTAREYVNARRRLCNAHLNAVTQSVDDFVTRCAGCLIEDYCEGAKDDVDEEIAIIEKWAREHPEERSEE